MATRFLSAMIILTLVMMVPSAYGGGGGGRQGMVLGWVPLGGGGGGKSECRGTVAECLGGVEEEEEFDLSSEVSRRILAGTRYISYGALRRDSVPCSRRGASYYNCRPGAQANPYTRGCNAITRCRS